MKTKNLILLSTLVLPLVSWAQRSVTLGGIMDVGVRVDRGGVNGAQAISVGSGLSNGSRLTFSGVEDLGGGNRAVFVMESGFSVDTGAGVANPPGTPNGILTFGRTSAVGIGNERYGYITAGRQYTPLFSISSNPASDPFIGSWLGGNTTVYSNTVRASNSIVYSYGYGPTTMLRPAPRQGLGVAVMYAPSETAGQSPGGAGMQYGFSASYGDGNWWVGYGQHRLHGNDASINPSAVTADTPLLRQQTLAVAYDFGIARLGAGINTARNDGAGTARVDRRGWTVSLNVPIQANQSVRVLYGRNSNKVASNQDFSTFQIGYQYAFSKRTSLYAAYGLVDNDAAAAGNLAGSLLTATTGMRPRSLIAGMLHTF